MEDLIQKGEGRGRTFQKLGGAKFFARKGINLKRGIDVEMGGGGVGATFFTTLQFRSVTFTLCVEKVRYPFITFQIFSLLS